MSRSALCLQLILGALTLVAAPCALDAQTARWGHLREMFPRSIDWPEGGAVGDVDGDGDLDLYVTQANQPPSYASPQDRLFLNDGRGRFADASSRLPVDADATYAVALGDLDRDGDLDAVVANAGAPCRIFLNAGQGYFRDAPALYPAQPAGGPAFLAVALADFDRDGDLDVFFAGETKLLWINTGGLFVDYSAANLPPGLANAWTRDVAVGDLDGNGAPDLLLGNLGTSSGEQDEIYLNAGNGSFVDATATHLPPSPSPTWAVDLGDVDRDGDLDLYVANIHQGGLPSVAQDQLFLNTGGGRFVEASNALPSETYNTNDAVFADCDGDGDLDVLAANGHRGGMPSQPDLVLRNDGLGNFTASGTGFTSSLIELSTHRWATGDFDADGDIDCIALASMETRVFLNRGNAEFIDATQRYPWLVRRAVAAGDFDRDGIIDLAAITDGLGVPSSGRWIRNCLLLRGRGNGEFVDVSSRMPSDIPDANYVTAGDLDLDGDFDLVFATLPLSSSSRILLAWNDGAGNFSTTPSLSLAEPIFGLELGDLDGDGRLDLAVITGAQAGWTRIFVQRGAGNFVELSGAVPLHPGYSSDLEFGDLDGDSDLDLFTTKNTNGATLGFENRVYRNAGNGFFTTILGALPMHAEPSSSVSLGDVDGDGDLDALVGNGARGLNATRSAVANRLYLNQGNGTFVDSSGSLPALPPDTTVDLALSDFDADGDLDAYVCNFLDAHRLYRNNGRGGFFDASSELPQKSGTGTSVAIADVDRDGDLDLCSADGGGLVLFNLQRQVAWRTPPSLGKTFAMDVHGEPNAPWVLLAAPNTSAIPLPPFGTLYLDPANAAIAAVGSLDAQGHASVDWRVPRWRALLGQTVYWQAVLDLTPKLSNFEITVVTDY
jgi:hypothetical protein